MKKYICYDGVEGDITNHDTEIEALEKLKDLLSDSIDFDEWMDGIENSFIAEVIHFIKPDKREATEDYFKDSEIKYFTEMNIKERSK